MISKSWIMVGDTVLRTAVGDISQMGTMDAIVNSANNYLNEHYGGVNTSIHKAAGPELLRECKKLNGCEKGKAVITRAYRIHARYIIHTVCTAWNSSEKKSIEALKDCYKSSLDIAIANKVQKIAFPLIGSGDLSFPGEKAAKTAVYTVAEYLKQHPHMFKEIVWVLYDQISKKYMDDAFAEITGTQNQEKSVSEEKKSLPLAGNTATNTPYSISDINRNIRIHCIYDFRLLSQKSEIKTSVNGLPTMFHPYICPDCRKEYSCIPTMKDLVQCRTAGLSYTNIDEKADKKRLDEYLRMTHHIKAGSKCLTYNSNAPTKCTLCGNASLQNRRKQYNIPGSGQSSVISTKYCEDCDMYFLLYTNYEECKSKWKLLNTNEHGLWLQEQSERKIPQNTTVVQTNNVKTNIPAKQKTIPKESAITAKDFVVRRAVFKCRYNNHSLQDIQAVFTTISRFGTVSKIKIPAGYCPDCNTYFIMESTYQRIKRSGVPICRTMDEKTYVHNNKSNGTSSYSVLAQESVLKQFGYSVNQVDDLPPTQRKMILAALVDNKVLTKNDVIGYLDYFINNRKNQKNPDGSKKYQVAISRWKDDRDFIQHYKTGTYKEVRIQKIVTSK